MYSAIWKILPGPKWLKALEALALAALIVYALFEWGYPWLNDHFPWFSVTVED